MDFTAASNPLLMEGNGRRRKQIKSTWKKEQLKTESVPAQTRNAAGLLKKHFGDNWIELKYYKQVLQGENSKVVNVEEEERLPQKNTFNSIVIPADFQYYCQLGNFS
ncbi:hypothetical protein ABEB36_007647 [Hypothenemus hampei]|uniref:Uncharacterized protein n=1 Tax=Hypothenemus hampei TaxID=57062 RepID=A0ABD1EUP9_HYPHA